jgi:chromosome segregation ATPase
MVADYRFARLRPANKQGPRLRGAEIGENLMHELDNVIEHLQPRLQEPRARDNSALNLDAALGMVNRAAEVLGMLERRVRDLEVRGQEQVEQAKRDFEVAEAKAASFEQRALDSEGRADELEARLKQAERRATEAEELEARLREADQRVKEADEWLARFHDTITSVFSARPVAAPHRQAA